MSVEHKWAGSVAQSTGVMTFTGRIGDAKPHAHAAVQILQIRQGHVDLEVDREVFRIEQTVAIATGTKHSLRPGPATWGRVTYLDAERVDPTHKSVEFDSGVIAGWLARADRPAAIQPLVRRALDLSREMVRGPLLLKDLAADLGVSPSRLGHVFADELGISYPSWRRWARLETALAEAMGGATLTDAAHAAGFADSAHLTRTCRQMFGITPSEAVAALRGMTSDDDRKQ